MARFGGNEFTGFSVPLIFEGRYFVLEPGDPPLLSVFIEIDGEPVFEVLKNKGCFNPHSVAADNATGVVTITDKATGGFLYKVRPGSETSIAFGRIGGEEISVRLSDRSIQVGGITVENNRFHGNMAGVVVGPDGSVGIGAPLPAAVLRLLGGSKLPPFERG